jgi:hypothetical protein
MSDQEKFAREWGKLIIWAAKNNIELRTVWLWRTVEQQQELHLTGKSNCDGILKRSPHQNGRAGDGVIFHGEEPQWARNWEYEKLGEYWQSRGGRWGGMFSKSSGMKDDIYHFEV